MSYPERMRGVMGLDEQARQNKKSGFTTSCSNVLDATLPSSSSLSLVINYDYQLWETPILTKEAKHELTPTESFFPLAELNHSRLSDPGRELMVRPRAFGILTILLGTSPVLPYVFCFRATRKHQDGGFFILLT
ncbi:hypothetical protein TWF506_008760 [Arthrobotrys conoides]|uniref:Uncharacterized protein n=1 Tax=Arthrobotrys conoides TaxID=74498 RepID=A0AAN8NQB6_9PEZI